MEITIIHGRAILLVVSALNHMAGIFYHNLLWVFALNFNPVKENEGRMRSNDNLCVHRNFGWVK